MQFRFSSIMYRMLKASHLWKQYYFIIQEFRFFKKISFLALVFTLLAAIFEGFGIGFVLTFLQNLLQPDAKPIATEIDWFDHWFLGIDANPGDRLFRISILILLITLLRLSFMYFGRLYVHLSQVTLAYRLRLRVFEQLQSLSLSYFTKTRSGHLINSLTSEVYQITLAFDVLAIFITRGSTLVAYIVSSLLLSWHLTLLSVLLFSLLSIGLSTLLGQVREASFDRSKANSWFTSIALEFVNGIRTVHAFAAQEFEHKRFNHANSALLAATAKSRAAQALVEPLSEGAATVILIGILLMSFAVLIPQGQLEAASLLTFLFVLLRSVSVMRQVNAARSKFSTFHGSLRNIKSLLKKSGKIYLKNGQIPFYKLKQGIEFIDVDFGYNSNELVLQNISLTIVHSQLTALVGSSGSGKSTLVDLIPRFYDPTQGQILFDGVNLQDFDVTSLRRKLAVVSQDTFIFNTSVRDNIAYALEGVGDTEIWEAAQLANALEFIQQLPEGMETQLGDRGVRLSGGQRQRLAIARAILRNPEILILDEATSALDSVSERLIQNSLEKLAEGRTVIAIAHRLSTIVRADKIVVLEQGRIVEQGGYQELLNQRGKLWKYHQMQYELGHAS